MDKVELYTWIALLTLPLMLIIAYISDRYNSFIGIYPIFGLVVFDIYLMIKRKRIERQEGMLT